MTMDISMHLIQEQHGHSWENTPEITELTPEEKEILQLYRNANPKPTIQDLLEILE